MMQRLWHSRGFRSTPLPIYGDAHTLANLDTYPVVCLFFFKPENKLTNKII